MVLSWRNELHRLGRAAGYALAFVAAGAACGSAGAPDKPDAAEAGPIEADLPDRGAPALDASFVDTDATADGKTDRSDSDGSFVDGAPGELDAADATSSLDDSGGGPLDSPASEPTGPCNATVEPHPIEGFTHVAVCSHVTYSTKPPSSGDHYPIWAAYRSYSTTIPEGFWVHDLEHGAVVLSYNCPGGCASDVNAAESWIAGLSDDPLCNPSAGDPRLRVIMTPDPNLDVKFAASAWGWTLRADCFDPVAFGSFAQAHYGHGPEALCAQGQDLSLGVQDGCGE